MKPGQCHANAQFLSKKTKNTRCPEPTVEGSIYCEQHRADALGRVSSLRCATLRTPRQGVAHFSTKVGSAVPIVPSSGDMP